MVDGRSTAENPFPTEKVGYNATKRALFLSPLQKKRKAQPTSKTENYVVTKVRKTKMGKDHGKETLKPPYNTSKSHSQSTTEVDTTVDDIDFTQLEESLEESNSDVYNFNSTKYNQISPCIISKTFRIWGENMWTWRKAESANTQKNFKLESM